MERKIKLHLQDLKIKIWPNTVPTLKSCQTYLNFCALADLKVLNTKLKLIFKIFYLNTKFKQITAKIQISSDLLENVCTSQFEGTSNIN